MTSQQIAVYEEFARYIPGFLSTPVNQDPAVLLAKQVTAAGNVPMPGGQPPVSSNINYRKSERTPVFAKGISQDWGSSNLCTCGLFSSYLPSFFFIVRRYRRNNADLR